MEKKERDRFAEMEKNTVDAKNQLSETEFVKFHCQGERGTKIMLVGNSITLHGRLDKIGWYASHGMAASAEDKDYVHILEREVLKVAPDSAFCICQVAEWERQYKDGGKTHSKYSAARDFDADIIVIRCIENCPKADFDSDVFTSELHSLIGYLNKSGNAKIIITTGFWRHPGDDALREYALGKGFPCVELGDLGEQDSMKAVGLFEHSGVANHPGDLGMKMIAERISAPLTELVRSFAKH